MQIQKDFLFSILTNITGSFLCLSKKGNIESEDLNDFLIYLVSVQGLSEREVREWEEAQ